MFNLSTPLDQLPFPVQRLPDEARELWLRTYEATYEQTSDVLKAELAAWGAIRREDMLTRLGFKSALNGIVTVSGWAMLFSNADNLDISQARTYFDENTQTALEYYQNAPLFYEHDGAYGIIGKRTLADVYPHGIWLEHDLDPKSPHFSEIVSELERGVLFYSTDSIEHFVDAGYNPEDSHIGLWYLAGCSLTKNPAEPGLGPVTFTGVVNALKSAQGKREASADTPTTSDNPPPQNDKDNTIMELKQLAILFGLEETATLEEVVAKIQSLLEATAVKMDGTEKEDEGAVKSQEDVALLRDALTMEGQDPPTDEQLRVVLASALESLGVEIEMEEFVEEPIMATASMKNAGRAVMGAMKNSTTVDRRMPYTTNANSPRTMGVDGFRSRSGNGSGGRGFGTPVKRLSAKAVVTQGIVAMAEENTRKLNSLGFKSATKAMQYGQGALGGWLANRETSDELLELFYARTAVVQAGARIYPMTNTESVTIPRMIEGTTAYWAADGIASPDSEPQFGGVTLQLREAVAFTYIPNRLLQNSLFNLENIVMNDMEKSIRLLVDQSALRGSGGKPAGSDGRELLGVRNTPNVNVTSLGTNGKTPSATDFTNAWRRLHEDNVPPSETWGVIVAPRTEFLVKNTTDTTGQLIPAERFTQGHGLYSTTQIPVNQTVGSTSDNSEAYFGDWQYLYMGVGQDIVFNVSTEYRFAHRQLSVQTVMYIDSVVAYPQAFEVLTGVRGQ